MPDGKHIPGQPLGFWMSPLQDLVRLRLAGCDEGPVLTCPWRRPPTALLGAKEGEDGENAAVLVGRLR
jgi:hypothetical protein